VIWELMGALGGTRTLSLLIRRQWRRIPATWALDGWPARMVLSCLRYLSLLFSVVRPKSGHLSVG
jgi:hypothetical protein